MSKSAQNIYYFAVFFVQRLVIVTEVLRIERLSSIYKCWLPQAQDCHVFQTSEANSFNNTAPNLKRPLASYTGFNTSYYLTGRLFTHEKHLRLASLRDTFACRRFRTGYNRISTRSRYRSNGVLWCRARGVQQQTTDAKRPHKS